MSQHDFNIANQGFPATRADINNAFQAIASNSSGATAPSTTYANMWWYDTTNNKMYLRNEADSAWIEVATIDQTNNEWQITTGTIQAADSDGLALKTDDGTTRLFIKDSDGAVGIGTASPSNALHVTNSSATVATGYFNNTSTTGDSPSLLVQGGANNAGTAGVFQVKDYAGNTEFYVGGTGNVAIGGSPITSPAGFDKTVLSMAGSTAPAVVLRATSGNEMEWALSSSGGWLATADNFPLRFATNNTERMRILTSGGITFNGDTAAANALDDYEEGNFTIASPSSGYTLSSQIGRYTKIGRLVVVNFQIQFSAVASTNSQVSFSSVLPYTSHASFAFDGSVREQSTTGAIYVTRIGNNTTDFTMNSMDGVGTGQQRTIRTGELYTGTISYITH